MHATIGNGSSTTNAETPLPWAWGLVAVNLNLGSSIVYGMVHANRVSNDGVVQDICEAIRH